MTNNEKPSRLLLVKTLNLPRAKRANEFLDVELRAGRLNVGRAQRHSELMRFAEAETEILEKEIEQLRQDVEGLKRELRSYQ